mgnify:CR=1 FL=1|jgi:DNA-directed RNA polymerase, mitochondrial
MKSKIVERLNRRLVTEVSSRNSLKFLLETDISDYIDDIIATLYLYTRTQRGNNKTVYLTEVIAAIGHSVRSRLKMKTDSGLAAKGGAFFLYTFEEFEVIEVVLGQGRNGHNAYIIQVANDDMLTALWGALSFEKTEKLPALEPYAPWVSSKHISGMPIVKTMNREVLEEISVRDHPLLFECLNKAQQEGWQVNSEIFDIQVWALRNRTSAFRDIWDQQDPEAKKTKLREAKAISNIASRFRGLTFYHVYYYDFRGRKYPATAYLHEQGSDIARGLLRREASAPIGKAGFYWLMVSIASTWAGDSGRQDELKTDKIPLNDRELWALDNEEILIDYAKAPKVNQGWMAADKPWQFLAACMELVKVREWQGLMNDADNYEYVSHLECYIDGSNNGSQHLAALTRDETTAPHVNLVPLELPGDLYAYVAEYVWEALHDIVMGLPKSVKLQCDRFIDNLIELKKLINAAERNSDVRKELIVEIQSLKIDNEDIADLTCAVYWDRVTDSKQRRKIVKRNIMTLPYGGSPYGLGQQQIDDSKRHGIEQLLYLEHKWGAYMGRLVYDTCKRSLKRPMQLLTVFEAAGRQAEKKGEFLSWHVPKTNFPVVQNYTEGTVSKLWVQYGPPDGPRKSTGYYENTLQLHVCFIEKPRPSKRKQSQGASPNAIHSLDAAHLIMAVCRADFGVTTIHDSFGCLLSDMPTLFRIIRETFVELYEENPLEALMHDIDGDLSDVQIGTLEVSQVLDSEYCFC